MSDRKVTAEQHENSSQFATLGRRRRLQAHCKCRWWIYLISCICLIVMIVCLVIFVAVPNIAQDRINDSKLEIHSIKILDPQADSYIFELDATVTSDSSVSATIGAFRGNMYLADLESHSPFSYIDFPESKASKRSEIKLSQRVQILDKEAFLTYNQWFMANETLNIGIEGSPKVQASGLARKYSVKYRKTFQSKGLNRLEGLKVNDGQIDLRAEDEEPNFTAKADVPNASDSTLQVGNLTFTAVVGSEIVGNLSINNVILEPGSNLVNVSASLNQARILSLAQSPDYCSDGIVPFTLVIDSVTNRGTPISYLQTSLASNNQTLNMDIGEILEKDLGYTIECQ